MSDHHSSSSTKQSSGLSLLTVLRLAYKEKPFHFYGRMSRSDFWIFLLSSYVLLAVTFFCYFIPYIGDLLIAVGFIYVFICQLSATVRRLHDINLKGYVVALPYIFLLIYFVMLIPVYAMYHDHADLIMNIAKGITALSYIALLALCLKQGNSGSNRFGTDPLDLNIDQKDFINPDHLEVPEYVGDPWRKFKNKHASNSDRDNSNQQRASSFNKERPKDEKTVLTSTAESLDQQGQYRDNEFENMEASSNSKDFKDVFDKDLKEMMAKDINDVAKEVNQRLKQ